jgi:Tol biopolymer transport system component
MKDRARRLHSIADARVDLESAFDRTAPAPATRWPAWQKWSAAAALALAIGGAGYLYGRSGTVPTATATYSIELDLPEAKPWAGVAISPDGKAVAVSAAKNIQAADKQLIIRYFNQLNGWRPVTGGEGGEYPFWSPDGKHLAFFAGGKLLRVDPLNGAPVVVCTVQYARGGVWLEDGTIVFAPYKGPLMRVDAQRPGEPAVFVPLERGEESLRYPVTAGPRQLLYLAAFADGAPPELRTIRLDAPQRPTMVMKTPRSGVYERGYLFYDRDGFIIGQRFDPLTNRLQGEPVRVTSDVATSSGHSGYLPLAAAAGHVAVAEIPEPLMQLVWKSRDGEALGDLGDAMNQWHPNLSSDGKRLAVARRLPGQSDTSIWVVDAQSAASRKLTAGAYDLMSVWAPDGQRIAFTSAVGLAHQVNAMNVDGPAGLTSLVERDSTVYPFGWTADGRFVWSASSATVSNAGRLGIFISTGTGGSREPPVPFGVESSAFDGRLSGDGKYIAYVSRKTGRAEVYVDTFPTPAEHPERISADGGQSPRWRRDSREIYFAASDQLMAVSVTPGGTTPFGVPTKLFTLPAARGYAVMPDGSKFLVLAPRTSPSSSLKLSLNWFASLPVKD